MAALGTLVLVTGAYNISANRGHWPITRWVLEIGMQRSVRTWSLSAGEAPPLDDDRAALGARHFHDACMPCHGAPGYPANVTLGQMLPSPPDLARSAPGWRERELFWIAKNGIKYTGMPGWLSEHRDDEVWSVVAFLRRLPLLDGDTYRRLARPPAAIAEPLSPETPRLEGEVEHCDRCHAAADPRSSVIPRLAGQSAAYLELSLRNYVSRQRHSGIMQSAVRGLLPEDLSALATHYALQATRRTGGQETSTRTTGDAAQSDSFALGRRIAEIGLAERDIPACLRCHADTARASFPRLAGQPATYLATQLELLQRQARDETAQGAIMSVIASRLSHGDIEAVTAYLASLGQGASADRALAMDVRP